MVFRARLRSAVVMREWCRSGGSGVAIGGLGVLDDGGIAAGG